MESILTLVQFIQEAHHFDKDITLAINSLHSPISDSVWMVFSNKEIWYILYLAVLVMFFYRLGWKKALVALLACVLCIVVCDQTCNLFKDSVQRLRPCLDGEMISHGLHILERAGARNLYGFFSAHAANAMGFAACSLMCFRMDKSRKHNTYGICIFIWAILVGISRVFVGKHFLGDVICGFAFGLAAGLLIGYLACYLGNRFIQRES